MRAGAVFGISGPAADIMVDVHPGAKPIDRALCFPG
jgi:hypothetical protein